MKRNLLFCLSLWMLCAFTTTVLADEVDYTSSIVNADLSTTDAWNTEGTKGIKDGMVKVGSQAVYDFSQTITIPAGQYKLTAKAVYRYGSDEQAEYDAIKAGTDTHKTKLYVQTSAETYEANVYNRNEGASETDHAAGNGSVTINEKFVPNSSAAVQAWFDAGHYVNELVFNVLEEGQVKIGITTTDGVSGDYVNIGAWTLTRTGDAQNTGEGEGEGEGDDTNTIDVDKTSLVGTSKAAWNAPLGPVTIDGISMPEKYEETTETLGDVMWQTVTGLDNGTYTVELYANARYTSGRGFDCPVTDGAMDCTFLFANNVELSIPVVYNPDLNNGLSFKLEGVEVTDGTLRMGMTKKAAGSNWHTIQIKSLTLHTTGDAALVSAKETLAATIAAAQAITPTTDELTAAIATAQGVYDTATVAADVDAATAALEVAITIANNANSVAGASATNPIATNFVVNGTFDTAGETSPWKTTTGAQNQTTANNQAGAFTGNFFENWNGDAYTGKIYQTIENIPNGVYELSICAFVNNFNASCQYVYANDAKTYLTTGAPTAYTVLAEVTNNTIEIGFEQTTAIANWAGIDNASLTYYGPGTLADLAALVTYNSALAAANEAAEKDMLPSVKETLEAVIAANSNVDKADLASLAAATEALNAAVLAATPSIISHEVLANGVPNNSLDGWTCTNTNTFQVNTWSTEADNTGMVTPFIENWVGRPGPLGVGKVYYTMKDIAPGSYRVSALIRVYSESGAEPAGANFFAGDQTVDITTGTAFTYNGMKGIYSNYSAVATVGEDGVLTFGLDITAPTFNWVAIKDVKVMKYVEPVAEFEVTMVNPAGATAEKIAEGESVEFTTNWDDKVGFMLMTVEQIDPATSEVVDVVTSFGTPTKGETSWKAEAYFDVKFREGFNYKFTFYAYENEDAYNQEPLEAPYSAAIATDEVEIAGALAAYVYSAATLNDIKPAYDAVIESETDNVVTLTFSAPVKVQDAQSVVREGGFMAPPTVYTYTPVAVEADENGFATTWTFEMKLFPGSTNVTFAAVDAEGRRVQGNMGEEEESYFSYEWTCTVGIPDITIAPAGEVEGPVAALTASCEVGIGDFTWMCEMSEAVVLDAEGNVVATVAEVKKEVDSNLEQYSEEWYEALKTTPNTLVLSTEITEPGTYTVKIPAGYFTVDSEKMFMSKAVEATFTIIKNVVDGINGISAGDVVKTQYFGLNGAAIDAPVKGINIVKQTLKNGKVVTSKVYVK